MTSAWKFIVAGILAILVAGAAFVYFISSSQSQIIGEALLSPATTTAPGAGSAPSPGGSVRPGAQSPLGSNATTTSGSSLTSGGGSRQSPTSSAPQSIKTIIPQPKTTSQISTTAEVATSSVPAGANANGGSNPTSPSVSPSPDSALPPVVSIDPQSIVGVLCYFNTVYTDEQTGQSVTGTQEEVRGSGVLISSKGDVLTNEHVVVQPEATATILDGNGNDVLVLGDFTLDHCEIGQIPAGDTLPTVAEIQSINPFIQVPVLAYTSRLAYVPPVKGMSDLEIGDADFAILHIDGLTSQAATFGVTALPKTFPYAKLLAVDAYGDTLTGNQVITYGYPGDVTDGQGNAFETFTMTGSVGHITAIYGGDQLYNNIPLEIDTDMEIYHGRSGSPLFWRGYDIGIVTFFIGNNRTDSGSVAVDAVIKSLEGTQYWPQR
jgi:hypothetical protein